jgi:hypothetical protein
MTKRLNACPVPRSAPPRPAWVDEGRRIGVREPGGTLTLAAGMRLDGAGGHSAPSDPSLIDTPRPALARAHLQAAIAHGRAHAGKGK